MEPYLLSFKIKKIIINTYGPNMTFLIGSAGDYWESKLYFSEMTLENMVSKETIWKGKLETYAKLKPCPVKMDTNFFKEISRSISAFFSFKALSAGGNLFNSISNTKSYMDPSQIDYIISKPVLTPYELAARKAAVDFQNRVLGEVK